MAFGWDESRDAHEEVNRDRGEGYEHQAKFSHELIAGAAAFGGFKLFEDHQRKQGKPVSHAFAKELLAGFAAGEVDKLIESKGRDYYDAERAKHHAKENAEHMYDEHYVKQHQANEYNPGQYPPPPRISDSGNRS
ncbi:MAG: hypothetical protein M1813_003734 [Trichoglossum hirsutum]|nr:MAG: hypothetical protein M1813_003734 [Trichoglossum hirsutum]